MSLRDGNSIQGTHTDLTLVVAVMIYLNCSITLRSHIIWWPCCNRHWILPPSWKGDYGDAMPCEQQCMLLRARLGQSGVPTLPENLPLHSQRSLCLGEYGRHKRWDQGLFLCTIWYTRPVQQAVLVHAQIPTDSDMKDCPVFPNLLGKALCTYTPKVLYSQSQGSEFLFQGNFFQVKRYVEEQGHEEII